MIFRFLKNLAGPESASEPSVSDEDVVEYNGFSIAPAPIKDAGGWRVAAVIFKEIDGERCTHHLVRADVFADRDFAGELAVRKAKLVIDEKGDKVLVKPPKPS